MKSFRYLVEGFLISGLIGFFRLLPLDAASAIGGFIGRNIGTHLSVNRKALRNITLALPGQSDAEYKNIIRGMWDNLGRTFAEYPHLEKIAFERMTSTNADYMRNMANAGPSIFFGGHLSNWEAAAAFAYSVGLHLDLIYRAPNNPHVEGVLQDCRSMGEKIRTYPKSSKGMRDVFAGLKAKRHIGILIDQKYNQGLALPFFGRTAMTSPAFVQLAQKFNCPLHPARVERIKGANFHITIYPAVETTGRAVEDVVLEANAMLENWIRARPEQWLWVHNRWRNKDGL